VIGHLNSGTTIPASKIYSDANIPQISPSATNPKYTRQGYKTTFRVVADDVHLGSTLGKYAVATLKGKSIGVIDDRTAYGQGVAEEFKKAVEAAYGVTIVSVNTMNVRPDRTTKYTKSGLISGKTNAIKKAIVQVQEGETIDFYNNI